MSEGHRIAASEEKDSRDLAHKFFQWLIAPMPVETFYADFFEKRPLYIQRNKNGPAVAAAAPGKKAKVAPEAAVQIEGDEEYRCPIPFEGNGESYYDDWFSIQQIYAMFDDPKLTIKYGEDIDIAKYEKGKRSTLNLAPGTKATGAQIRKFLADGASLRFLCPQNFSDPLWRMVSILDEFWGCQAGSNSYLTPAGTQGFAPHFDDVDIFVIQTEGAKRWRLYPARSPSEVLPDFSSRNFTQDEIGSPFLDVVLRKGDMLYAPRGTIHQCVAQPDAPSLHVTVSTALKNSWVQASTEIVEMRRSLPRNYFNYMGVAHAPPPNSRPDVDNDDEADEGSDDDTPERASFKDQFAEVANLVLANVPFDAVADQMALDFMHSRVPIPPPPAVTGRASNFLCSIDPMFKKHPQTLAKGTMIKLLKHGVIRLVVGPLLNDDGSDSIDPATGQATQVAQVYHIQGNSRIPRSRELQCLQFTIDHAPAIEHLINSYPKAVRIDSLPYPPQEDQVLPLDSDEWLEKVAELQLELANELFSEGVLLMSNTRPTKSEKKQARAAAAAATEDAGDDSGNDDESSAALPPPEPKAAKHSGQKPSSKSPFAEDPLGAKKKAVKRPLDSAAASSSSSVKSLVPRPAAAAESRPLTASEKRQRKKLRKQAASMMADAAGAE